MASFLESVSKAASGKSSSDKKKDEGKGLNFQQRLNDLLGGPGSKKKSKD